MQKYFSIFALLKQKPNIMSNYPAGAENDSRAPFNQTEKLQGEDVELFGYIQNLEMPYEVSKKLESYISNLEKAYNSLGDKAKEVKDLRPELSKYLTEIKHLIAEPQFFLENE